VSRSKGAIAPSLRIGLPELFDLAKFEQVLILTYGADLEFYERVLRRHFGGYRNQIVLGDGRLLAETFSAYQSSGLLRHLNRSWVVAPVDGLHAVHAKVILLAGPDSGLLLVGSGNMNLPGYAGSGECFTPYRWSGEESDQLHAFTAIRDLTEGLRSRGLVDGLAADRLRIFWEAYDWWNDPPDNGGPVRHNLSRPLGDQLLDLVGGEAVQELTVATPFHDPKCASLKRLIERLKPKRVRVLVQDERCSVDPMALTKALEGVDSTVHTISAVGDDRAYLHAKILHVRTSSRDICLTGSANCSMVALWKPHPGANVEVGNLVASERGSFDRLFDPSVVSISRPIAAGSLNVRLQSETDPDSVEAQPRLRVSGLTWRPPNLSCEISAAAEHEDVSLSLGGRLIQCDISVSAIADGWTSVSALIDDAADKKDIDEVAVITIHVEAVGEVSAVPYQPHRLKEQDHRRVDMERLRQAARLEIDDPDLLQALAALEGILIGDNVAKWTKASADSGFVDEEGVSVFWDDIDWEAVRLSGLHRAYGGLGALGVPGSELAAYLEALAKATKELIDPPPPSSAPTATAGGADYDDEPEWDAEGGVEGVDPDDIDDTPETARRQSMAARNRRLLRNFIRRNIKTLEHPSFRDGAGPGVVVLNLVILNWLCWWVATSDAEHSGELIEERIRLWHVMWGEPDQPGYFDSLTDELKALALDTFEDQRFGAVMLASVVDAWSWIKQPTESTYRRLRQILRSAVLQPCWQVDARDVAASAALNKARPTARVHRSPGDIADICWKILCEPIDDGDVTTRMASVLSMKSSEVTMSSASIHVEPGLLCAVSEASFGVESLSTDEAQALFSAWMDLVELPYYRLRWLSGVALYKAEQACGWHYEDSTNEMTDFGALSATSSPTADWARWLAAAVEAAEQQAA
jgi:hypothetical protein